MATQGPVHAVPCAACGYKLDFRELLVASDAGETLHANMDVSCDACGMMLKVTGVQKIMFVGVESQNFRAPGFVPQQVRQLPQQQQQASLRPGMLQRMLKKR